MHDLANNIGIVQAVAPAVLTETTWSEPIDLLGFESIAVIVTTGAVVGDGNFTVRLEESETGEEGSPPTFFDVNAKHLVGVLPALLPANSVVKVGYIGFKRYLRLAITKNSGTSIAAAAVVVKGNAHQRPVT